MKPILKLSLLVLVIFALGFASCKKYTSTVIIENSNVPLCACCIGTFQVSIDGDTTLRFCDNSPTSLGFNNNTSLPVYLKANWEYDPKSCIKSNILITSYEPY